jgi:hypothetical protein
VSVFGLKQRPVGIPKTPHCVICVSLPFFKTRQSHSLITISSPYVSFYKNKKQKTRQIKANNKANQGNSRQFKAIQGNTRQYKAIQGNTRQYKAIQGNTRQSTRQFKAIQGKRGDILPVIMFIFKTSHQFLCRSQDIRTNVSNNIKIKDIYIYNFAASPLRRFAASLLLTLENPQGVALLSL